MKKTIILMSVAGLLAQVLIARWAWLARQASALHWSEMLAGKPLPQMTEITLSMLPMIPAIAAAGLLLVLILGFSEKREKAMLWGLFGIILAEACALSYMAVGVIGPALSITYQMTNG